METLYEFGTDSPADFRFSPDGRYLYGSSYYTGASNVFRYDLSKREMEVLSNAETGFFRPVPVKDDALLVFKFTDADFVPGWIPIQPVADVGAVRFFGQEIVDKYPDVKTWMPPSPASIPIESLIQSTGRTAPSATSAQLDLPDRGGLQGLVAVGFRADFRNPLRFNGFDLSASYSAIREPAGQGAAAPGVQLPLLELDLERDRQRGQLLRPLRSDHDGPQGLPLGLEYAKYLLYDMPRTLELVAKAAGYWGLDKLPDYQNVEATYDSFMSGRIGLRYTDVRRSLGAVDEEKGFRLNAFAQTNYVNGRFYPRFYGVFDYGLALPLKHSSLWLRTTAGQSIGERDNNFVNFYFGGFGNNWIDCLGEKRYREYYSFPGLEINALGGRNFARAMLEWTLPAIHFRRLGAVNMFCNWARLGFFASSLVTDFEAAKFRRQAVNFGAQLDLRIVLFSLLNTTVSLGYARAKEHGFGWTDEFMLSLKLL